MRQREIEKKCETKTEKGRQKKSIRKKEKSERNKENEEKHRKKENETYIERDYMHLSLIL